MLSRLVASHPKHASPQIFSQQPPLGPSKATRNLARQRVGSCLMMWLRSNWSLDRPDMRSGRTPLGVLLPNMFHSSSEPSSRFRSPAYKHKVGYGCQVRGQQVCAFTALA